MTAARRAAPPNDPSRKGGSLVWEPPFVFATGRLILLLVTGRQDAMAGFRAPIPSAVAT